MKQLDSCFFSYLYTSFLFYFIKTFTRIFSGDTILNFGDSHFSSERDSIAASISSTFGISNLPPFSINSLNSFQWHKLVLDILAF